MEAKLYVILGSHACRTGMLLLEHKGIEYRRVELPTGFHPLALRLLGFAANDRPFRLLGDRSTRGLETIDRMGTVPSLVVDGRRVKTNREIARHLDAIQPDPPLFPADLYLREAVEEAERFGDEVLQMVARRLGAAACVNGLDGLIDRGQNGRLGPLLWRRPTARRAGMRLVARMFRAGGHSEQELLAGLPAMLDRIDGWIDAGVLNGDRLYAADLMIAPSLALLCYRRDACVEIERRPALCLVDRVLPEPSDALPA
jgi:glutathione S-transferase